MTTELTALRSRDNDQLWSVREDLHARFGAVCAPHVVNGVLDSIAVGRQSKVTIFSKIFIEREAAEVLVALAANRDSTALAA